MSSILQTLTVLYEKILKTLHRFPEDYTYRKSTEGLIQQRLATVKLVSVCTKPYYYYFIFILLLYGHSSFHSSNLKFIQANIVLIARYLTTFPFSGRAS